MKKKFRFHFSNLWLYGLNNRYDFHFSLFEIHWTWDVDFRGFKVVVCNFIFSWYKNLVFHLVSPNQHVSPVGETGREKAKEEK